MCDLRSGFCLIIQWYQGQAEKAFVLGRARAVVDAVETITRAPEKVGAETEAEAQKARERAAPAYLKDRASKGEALPEMEVMGQAGQHDDDEGKEQEDQEEEEEERRAVAEYMVRHLKGDLFVEVMQGLIYRRWAPPLKSDWSAYYSYY